MQDGKHVVLCLDDDQDILTALKLVLESAGYVVLCAASAAEGRAALERASPDLAIVDMMMEEVDSGLAFVNGLREAGSKVPVYLLSSAGDYLFDTTDLATIGADGVFQKPLAPDRLLKVVGAKLAQTALREKAAPAAG